MKIQKLACIFSILAFIASCSSENDTICADCITVPGKKEILAKEGVLTEQELKAIYKMRNSDNRIGMEEAVGLAREVSKSAKATKQVYALLFNKANNAKASVLKSGNGGIEVSDTIAYIINFSDSSGFAIVSFDSRVDSPVFAFSEKGSFNEKTDNPGVIIFLERLEYYILNSIAETERQKDSLLVSVMEKLDIKSFDILKSSVIDSIWQGQVRATTTVGPLIPVQWGQERPFSNLLDGHCGDTTDNSKYLAGCVATLIAQIMSYYNYPNNIDGYSLDWGLLNRYRKKNNFYVTGGSLIDILNRPLARSQVSRLFKQIGLNGSGVNMNYDYGCTGSTAQLDSLPNFLRRKGFIIPYPFESSYSYRYVVTSINEDALMMAYGCRLVNPLRECHVWAIDGYKTESTIYSTIYYTHHNWGWDGREDGFYLFDGYNNNPFFQNVKVAVVYR